VKLIEPSVKLIHHTPESLIAWTSRACYQSFEKQDEASDERLIRHFVANGESPLEFAWGVMDVTCSYAAHVHLLRHRFFAQQWRSQRYDEAMEFVVPGSLHEIPNGRLAGLGPSFPGEALSSAHHHYQWARENGAKKQDARYLIPQGVAVQGFMAGSARAWQSFFELRTSKKAMPETRQIALMMRAELGKVWPTVFGEAE